MSKKMLKRSLALGALMAFVITGSAMAAETNINLNGKDILIDNQTEKYLQSGYNGNQPNPINLNGTGVETVTLSGVSQQCAVASYSTGVISLKNLKEIVVNGVWRSNDASSDYAGNVFYAQGVGGNVAEVSVASPKCVIESDGILDNAIVFHATGGGKIIIDVDAINVKTTYTAVMAQAGGGIELSTTNNLVIDGQGALNTAGSNASIVINGKNVTLNASDATAGINLRGDSNNSIGVTAEENISITGSSAININTTGSSENRVTLNAKTISITDDGSYSSGYALRIKNGALDVNAIDKTDIYGDVAAQGTGTVEVDFGMNGSLVGTVTTENSSTTSLDLGTNSTWTATGDSNVTTVSGNGNIKVDITVDDGGEAKVAEVSIKNAIDTDDSVNVGATAAVTDYIAGLSGEKQTEAMKKVVESVKANGAAVTGTVTTDEGMVTGAYTLKVDGEEVTYTEAVNSKSDAVSDAGMTLKGHWRAHMNDMNKRMGELRNANGEHGVWTRMVRGESEYQGAKMQYNQYQLGYDEKLSVDKRWTVGAAVTFSEGDASYGSGSTDDKSTAFAIYGSKLNNDGTFVDLIARYAKLESDLDDRNYGTGDYDANGYSVSAEFGKRIQQGNGLWIEPQVELTYGSIDSADVAFSGNYKAHYDSMDSFIARAGFALGKDIKQGNVYARASYLYDFDGETKTQFEGGKAIQEDFGGGWWEVGVGANINLSKATYIYADIEKTFGGEVDTNWQWNLGVRYSF